MEKQNVPDFGRHGGLIIDEMTIQDDLIITKFGDAWNLVGFVDMGSTITSTLFARERKK